MRASTLTCRCRHCGYNICYSEENVGSDSRCSSCGQTIRLPGRLETLATIQRSRRLDRAGLAMEIGGFLLMFFVFPAGLIAGGVLLFFGWRKTNSLACSNCNTILPTRAFEACPGCRSKFGLE